jgi:hypothetical protein
VKVPLPAPVVSFRDLGRSVTILSDALSNRFIPNLKGTIVAKKTERGVKSQAIRDYLNQNKKAKAPEVVAALAEKGIDVSTAMVYSLKARNSMGKRRRQAEANGQEIGLSITHLIAAKKFVEATGGVKPAQEALAAFAKLV